MGLNRPRHKNKIRYTRQHKTESRFRPIGGIPEPGTCYRCSMPGPHPCDYCRKPMCGRHRNRKAGGNLCDDHKHFRLVQEIGRGSTRFKNAGGIARHHVRLEVSGG